MMTVSYIRSIRLPMSIRGFTIQDSEGEYNIYINDRLSVEQFNKTLAHEEAHIKNGDFLLKLPAHLFDK